MASDDELYVVVVDDAVGDSGTQVINVDDVDFDRPDNIMNDIMKHFNGYVERDIKSELHDNIVEFNHEYDDYNSTDSEQHDAVSEKVGTKSDFAEQNNCELANINQQNIDVAYIGKYLLNNTGEDLDVNSKIKIKEFIDAIIARAIRALPLPKFSIHDIVNGQYQCKFCYYTSKSEKSSIKHYRYKHGEKSYECFACHSRYRRHDTLLFHEHYCRSEESNLLRIARNIFNDIKPKREKIINKKDKYKKVPCRMCSKLICKANMYIHIEGHLQIKKYKCTICSASFRSNRTLKSHVNQHLGQRPYQCEECLQTFHAYNTLTSHKKMHNSVPKYECDMCKAKFIKEASLLIHRETHFGGESEQLCNECGNVFVDTNALQIHMKTHKTVAPVKRNVKYKCSECFKICNSLTNIKYHMKTRHNAIIYSKKKFLSIFNLPGVQDCNQVEGDMDQVVEDINHVAGAVDQVVDDIKYVARDVDQEVEDVKYIVDQVVEDKYVTGDMDHVVEDIEYVEEDLDQVVEDIKCVAGDVDQVVEDIECVAEDLDLAAENSGRHGLSSRRLGSSSRRLGSSSARNGSVGEKIGVDIICVVEEMMIDQNRRVLIK